MHSKLTLRIEWKNFKRFFGPIISKLSTENLLFSIQNTFIHDEEERKHRDMLGQRTKIIKKKKIVISIVG